MAWTSAAKRLLNRCLGAVNLRIETLTAQHAERRRLEALRKAGYFERPAFALPPAFERMRAAEILEETARHRARFDDFEAPSRNGCGYTFQNDFFSSPDAEVLYAVMRKYRPPRVVEVGSGNSTQLLRLAARDGNFDTQIVCVDPHPRVQIAHLADRVYRQPVELLESGALFNSLQEGDVLFIDSSHLARPGSDVVHLFLRVVPRLAAGVLVHVHDIFLPYEYPREWVMEKHWEGNEQYLVQQLLMQDGACEVLWAGYYLQRTRADFAGHFPHLNGRLASSLWLRKQRRG